ncbi:MAG: hypothetical protein IJT46_04265 [Bacteroidaceae bacterium]|nr:hypothetical protein [Bacteroidaceae bacterium]
MPVVLTPAICVGAALYRMKECLLQVIAVSATGERNAPYTPEGMPPVSRSRYCAGRWECLPSATAGGTRSLTALPV